MQRDLQWQSWNLDHGLNLHYQKLGESVPHFQIICKPQRHIHGKSSEEGQKYFLKYHLPQR